MLIQSAIYVRKILENKLECIPLWRRQQLQVLRTPPRHNGTLEKRQHGETERSKFTHPLVLAQLLVRMH